MAEYTLEKAFLHQPRMPAATIEEKALSALKLTTRQVHRVYRAFLSHLYPSLHMTVHSFHWFLVKRFKLIKPTVESDKLSRLFGAFNYHHNGHLSFHELLLGLTCLELLASGVYL